MANICSVTIEIFADDIPRMVRQISERMSLPIRQSGDSIACGNSEICIAPRRYLFDITAVFHQEESMLSIQCSAKWGIFDDDVVHIVHFLKKNTMAKRVLITYDEPGRAVYGQYEYSAGDDFIIDTYLPEESYPKTVSEVQSGDFETALCQFGVQNFIEYRESELS